MRYLLRSGNQSEIFARKDFLEQTFHLWFVQKETIGFFIVLESFPLSSEKEICLIYGHNYEVAHLLKNYRESIPEKNLFIIACLTNNPLDFFIPFKRIFIAPQNKKEGIKLRNGSDFDFEFDVSDIELNLFNSHIRNIRDKLLLAFGQT